MGDEEKLGTTRGKWWWIGVLVMALIVAAVVTVSIFIRSGDLPKLWAYPALFLGILTAFGFRILTVVKAAAEDKRN